MAEDDKRRRNTAASARFRVKKKQREQALEKQSKEMVDKVSSLEGRIQQLEMENQWLKGLITEKSGAKGVEEQYKLFKADQSQVKEAERSSETRKDGVGTEDAVAEEVEA
jgi:TolA-binding protein